jgi:hypothetical protein
LKMVKTSNIWSRYSRIKPANLKQFINCTTKYKISYIKLNISKIIMSLKRTVLDLSLSRKLILIRVRLKNIKRPLRKKKRKFSN